MTKKNLDSGKIKWKRELRKISELTFYKKNPRKLYQKQAIQLRKSLMKFGICQPVVVNCDGLIIGGHQRVAILRDSGESEVECAVPSRELTQKEVDELNIRLNKNTGEFDYEILANEWDIEELFDWGFDEKDLHIHEEKEKKKDCKITITISDEANLSELEQQVTKMIANYDKVKIKVSR